MLARRGAMAVTAFLARPLNMSFLRPNKRKACATWRMGSEPRTPSMTRRKALHAALGTVAAAFAAKHVDRIPRAHAAMYAPDVTGGKFSTSGDPNKLETYMPQIQAGYDALVDLNSSWKEKTKSYDGDVVRRVLGTVGVTSPLFNIRKTFFKAWQLASNSRALDEETIEDMDTEWNLVLDGISSIDFQLYSVSFTELEESKDHLIEQGQGALKDTIAHYASFLNNLKKAM